MPATWIAAASLAVSLYGSYKQSKARGDALDEQKRLWNEFLAARQKAGADILDRLIQGGNDPFGPQTTRQSSSTQGTSSSSTSSRSSTRPVITPEYKKLEGMFRGLMEGRLARPSALPPGYAERGVKDINASFTGGEAALRNVAARRGLSGEQTFGAGMPIQTARARGISDFLVDVPLKERELQTQDISLAGQLAQMFGLGSDTNTTSNTTGRSSSLTNSTMTTPPNISDLIALLMPPNPMGGPQGSNSVAGDTANALALALMQFYNMYQQRPSSGPGVTYIDRPVG